MEFKIYKTDNYVSIFEQVGKTQHYIIRFTTGKIKELFDFWNNTAEYGQQGETFDDFLISFALLKMIRKETKTNGYGSIKFKSVSR